MFILFQLSIIISIYTFMIGIVKNAWVYILLSAITSLPTALFFLLGAENAWRYVGLAPILLFAAAACMWFYRKKKSGLKNRAVSN